MKTTQLIIIGAGPGGYETAIAAARHGVETVLIEANALGGTCLNEGCIPTKCWCRSAEVLDTVRQSAAYGVGTAEATFDLGVAKVRKEEVITQLRSGIETLLKSPLITLVQGKAHFVSAHEVAVGDDIYTAPHIIIATGSSSKSLPVPGVDLKGVLDSSELLQLDAVPESLCIIGGGVIGLEFASVFNSFGTTVTVVEYAKEVLPAFDRDLAKRLRTSLKKRGIRFHLGAAVKGIVDNEGQLSVLFDKDGAEQRENAGLVLMSVGRKPNVDGLQLEAAGIEYSPRGIVVDEVMQTNVPGVYAVGDVNGLCPLAHAATAQGKVALHHITGAGVAPDLSCVPAAVFTVPEVATVGLTEEQAKAQQMAYTTSKAFYRANGKSLAMGATDGIVKLLMDEERHILGAHLMGAHAADLIHEVALAIHTRQTVEQLATLIHAHPSLSEIVHDAAIEGCPVKA